jgi:hypothetical protein
MKNSFFYDDDLSWDCWDSVVYDSSHERELTGIPDDHWTGYERNGCVGNFNVLGDRLPKCEGYAFSSDLMEESDASGTDEKLQFDEVYNCWIISE